MLLIYQCQFRLVCNNEGSALGLAVLAGAVVGTVVAVVLALRYWSELSEAQIARTLGISEGTVKSTASRALDRLEVLLGGTR